MEASITDSMYYTFSTIAQVLAGFIALSGVFIIFKIQEIKKAILGYAKEFSIYIHSLPNEKYKQYIEELDKILISGDVEVIINKIQESKKLDENIIESNTPNYLKITTNDYYERIVRLNGNMKCIMSLTRISIWFGIPTILLSILAIIFVTEIKCSFLVMIVLFIGAFISILFMSKTIFKILANKN